MPPKANSWKCKEEGTSSRAKNHEGGAEGVEGETKDQEVAGNTKWEAPQKTSEEKQPPWGAKGAEVVTFDELQDGDKDQNAATSSLKIILNQNTGCEKCGLPNHSTQECRRFACELCGLNNHITYDCKKCIPWNVGPELCATQVEDQSFFYIEECIDPRVAREKASIAVISVTSGAVNAKQLEMEFMNLIGAASWRWIAKPVGENGSTVEFLA